MYGYIYKTTNLVNGKIYIGQKHSNKFLGNKYLGSGRYLKNAVMHYGKENFKVELLEKCDSKVQLNEREIYWIDFYRNTSTSEMYNISNGGDGGDVYSGLSDEDKLRRSKKLSNTSSNRVRIMKDDKYKFIKKDELNKYLDEGWQRGANKHTHEQKEKLKNTLKHLIWITNGVDNRRILDTEDISNYPNYSIGFTHHSKTNIEKKQVYLLRKQKIINEYFKQEHFCERCGKLITRYIGTGRFCSKSCAVTHPHTDATKRLLSKYNKECVCGMRGKKLTEKQRKNHSRSMERYYSKNKLVWVCYKNTDEKRVLESDVSKYVFQGWSRGRIKGTIPWNKGLTKADSRVKDYSQKRIKTMMKLYNTLSPYKIKKNKED